MNSLRQLHVSTQLTQTIQDLHDETTMRLHNALQVSCTDFKPEPYSKVIRNSPGQSNALVAASLSLSITLMAAKWDAVQHRLFCVCYASDAAYSCNLMSGLLDPLYLFCQVLQGFMFLGHIEELGGQVASAFTNAVNTTVVQVTTPPPPLQLLATPHLALSISTTVLYHTQMTLCIRVHVNGALSWNITCQTSTSQLWYTDQVQQPLGLVAMQ